MARPAILEIDQSHSVTGSKNRYLTSQVPGNLHWASSSRPWASPRPLTRRGPQLSEPKWWWLSRSNVRMAGGLTSAPNMNLVIRECNYYWQIKFIPGSRAWHNLDRVCQTPRSPLTWSCTAQWWPPSLLWTSGCCHNAVADINEVIFTSLYNKSLLYCHLEHNLVMTCDEASLELDQLNVFNNWLHLLENLRTGHK